MKIVTSLVVLSLLTGPALAEGGYAGVGVGGTKADISPGAAPADTSVTYNSRDTNWKLFGGYEFHKNGAVELSYADLGTYQMDATGSLGTGRETIDGNALAIAAIGMLPFDNGLSVLGILGLAHWTLNNKATNNFGASSSSRESGNDLVLGLGAQFSVDRYRLRAELERYMNVGKDDTIGASNIDVFGVSAAMSF